MANALFDNYKNRIIGSSTAAHSFVDFDTDNIWVACYDTAAGAVNLATWQDYDDLAAADIIDSAILTSVTAGVVAAGRVDAADTTVATVTGDQFEELILWKVAGGATNLDPLICRFDTFVSGMPVTPNGGDVIIAWHASGIFGF